MMLTTWNFQEETLSPFIPISCSGHTRSMTLQAPTAETLLLANFFSPATYCILSKHLFAQRDVLKRLWLFI